MQTVLLKLFILFLNKVSSYTVCYIGFTGCIIHIFIFKSGAHIPVQPTSIFRCKPGVRITHGCKQICVAFGQMVKEYTHSFLKKKVHKISASVAQN